MTSMSGVGGIRSETAFFSSTGADTGTGPRVSTGLATVRSRGSSSRRRPGLGRSTGTGTPLDFCRLGMSVPDPRDGKYRTPAPVPGGSLAKSGGGLEELVEVAYPDHPVLRRTALPPTASDPPDGRCASRHACARLGAPHLERPPQLALGLAASRARRSLGVLETPRIAGDHVGVVVARRSTREVGGFEVEPRCPSAPNGERPPRYSVPCTKGGPDGVG